VNMQLNAILEPSGGFLCYAPISSPGSNSRQ
jgi:hypothetical protein